MVRRTHLMTLAVAIMLVFAGCSAPAADQAEKNSKELDSATGENVSGTEPGGTYLWEVKRTEQNQLRLVKAQPPVQMESSLERANLNRRYEYLNDRNNEHYVYLVSEGKVMARYIAQGKISSVNSKLTNDVQYVRIPGCDSRSSGNDCWKMVESPQMDGSYGTNGPRAVFFFTSDGKYVQTNMEYMVSEQPMGLTTPPELTKQVETQSEASSGSTGNTSSANETSVGANPVVAP